MIGCERRYQQMSTLRRIRGIRPGRGVYTSQTVSTGCGGSRLGVTDVRAQAYRFDPTALRERLFLLWSKFASALVPRHELPDGPHLVDECTKLLIHSALDQQSRVHFLRLALSYLGMDINAYLAGVAPPRGPFPTARRPNSNAFDDAAIHPSRGFSPGEIIPSRPDLGHSSLSPVNNPGAHPSLHAPHHSAIALFLRKWHNIRTSA